VEILLRAADAGHAVHDERAVEHHRFVERRTAQQDHVAAILEIVGTFERRSPASA
jgi:hypothetical protein